MNPLVEEWLRKAEEDYQVAEFLVRMGDAVASSSCVHSHQATEKYIKAAMKHHGIKTPKDHKLLNLATTLPPSLPGFSAVWTLLENLEEFGPGLRYPGVFASSEEAARSLEWATEVRRAVYDWLGLPLPPRRSP